ncbi:D-alanyl-D-alanine carboxypeptidase [Microtetraspora sp. NBRC 13810]|uniref:D-alanyl-D-alanine carboxypeptidase family protein n=1 Tax=Microtetraspora sp. NBRC 13810 TaxID=3030990 RepID=UPI0024A03C0A|nr:serine hydrolase [Microtetraspora sp. NBRC 13810]GLW12368.1 D-alanyl-D-alanine carboxypeptidase [Microtetraspora sp. NBRC 13810]
MLIKGSLWCAAVLAVAVASPAQAASAPAAAPVREPAASAPPAVPGRAAYLIDATTGTVHHAKSATRRLPVASLTKVMTAYVVLAEAGDLGDTVTVTTGDVRHAAANGATHAALRAGERLTTRDLLYALMLPSGADAAHALARRYGPGTTRFVAKMNTAARSLGLANTRYTNPDGLSVPSGGYSTAKDQVRLAFAALGDPTLRQISTTGRHAVPRTAVHHAHTWHNTNKLLGAAPGAIGVKTGYTRAAGYCLLYAAEREEHLLIGVILGDTQADRRFETAERLLEWTDATAP